MEFFSFLDKVWTGFLETSWLERLSVIFGVCQVLLSKSNKVSNYPFGILGIILGMVVLYEAKLYAEILLNTYYLVMSFYGWWYWTSGRQLAQQPITRSGIDEWKIVSIIVVVGFLVLFGALRRYTDSDVPVWDAWVACTAWAGMWLLAKRKIENWILLNVSNFFAIPLLFHKGLYLFALLTLILFIIAFFGYFSWRKIMQKQYVGSI